MNEPRAHSRGLLRTSRAGTAKTPAFLEDYALLIQGLLALHRAGLALDDRDDSFLAAARELWTEAQTRFGDPARPGVLYDTMADQSDLIVRTSSTFDGAMPSGPGVMLNNLIDLYELTGERGYLDDAGRALAGLSRAIAESPVGAAVATRGLNRLLRLDPALVEQIGADSKEPEVVKASDAPVQVFASTDRVVVSKEKSAELLLELHIAKGFHITAREPGVEGLSPFSVELEGGQGAVLAVEYPKGEPYEGDALPPEDRGRMLVYSGLLQVKVRVERAGEAWTGRPMIRVRYQACDDEACFQPMTVELDVAIDPG